MRLFRSLTNRIFIALALLALGSFGAAVLVVNRLVTAQAERELQRGLEEAGNLVVEYRALTSAHLAQQARLVADLPKFKAAVELNHPPTLQPLAADYRKQVNADLFVVANRRGRLLADEGLPADDWPAVAPTPADGAGERSWLWQSPKAGLVQVVSVPIWIDPTAPELLGTLSVGLALDNHFASEIRRFTESEIVILGKDGVLASTFAGDLADAAAAAIGRSPAPTMWVGEDEYLVLAKPLDGTVVEGGGNQAATVSTGDASHPSPMVLVLQSRTERLRFLRSVHTALGATAAVAVLVGTLFSYVVARTITRPLGQVTAAMRDTASTGDLSRRVEMTGGAGWEDEDARLLAASFNSMTTSLAHAQREMAQRERLSSLGRLSTVVAHEVRNPLMIIKAALRTLRKSEGTPERVSAAIDDIDGEVRRLNRLVNDVLDFARPVRIEWTDARLSSICERAVGAVFGSDNGCETRLDPAADAVVTDPDRLGVALVNLLTNAREAIGADAGHGADTAPRRPVSLVTTAITPGDVRIVVSDDGPGIAPDALRHMFEPFFTTKRTGTGIGLAITRNIIESLGGRIEIASTPAGTSASVTLPRVPVRGALSSRPA